MQWVPVQFTEMSARPHFLAVILTPTDLIINLWQKQQSECPDKAEKLLSRRKTRTVIIIIIIIVSFRVMASDADLRTWNRGATFWLGGEPGSDKFMVERSTGVIRLVRPLNTDQPDRDRRFLFTVRTFFV